MFWVVYFVSFVLTGFWMAGAVNAWTKGAYPTLTGQWRRRQDLFFSITWGFLAGIAWPFFLPFLYLETEGFKYGWDLTLKERT